MQILGPGLSGLTSVPVTTEGARKQREWYGERDVEEEGEAHSLICQWTPVGKPLANVNNAQATSMRKLDANDSQSHREDLAVSSPHLISHPISGSSTFLSWCHSCSLVFKFHLTCLPCMLIKSYSSLTQHRTTSLLICYNGKMLFLQYQVVSLCEKAPQAVSFFRLC